MQRLQNIAARTCIAVMLLAMPTSSHAANRMYVSNNGNAKLSVIDLPTNTVLTNISTGANTNYGVAVRGTGAYVADSGGNRVIIIDITNNEVERTITVGSAPKFIAFYNTGAYVTNASGNSVSMIDLTTNTVEATISVGSNPHGIGINGSTAYVANEAAGTVSVISLATNTVTATINISGVHAPYEIVFSGTGVYVAEENAGGVSVIDSTDNTIVTFVDIPDVSYGIAVSGTGIYVSDLGNDNLIVIDTTDNQIERTVSAGDGPHDVAISGTGVYVANANANTVSVFDITNLENEYTISLGANTPISIAFGGVPPTLSSHTPADEATDIALDANLELAFSEIVGSTGTGTVSIYKSSDDSLVEQITVTTSKVTGTGTTSITVNPGVTLDYGTSYYVRISSNAFPDRFGNFYIGIANATTWNFTTVAAPASSAASSPAPSSGSSGGVRASTLQMRIQSAMQVLAETKQDAALHFAAPKPAEVSPFEARVCQRVMLRFSDNATMLQRVNDRLQNRFGFMCG